MDDMSRWLNGVRMSTTGARVRGVLRSPLIRAAITVSGAEMKRKERKGMWDDSTRFETTAS